MKKRPKRPRKAGSEIEQALHAMTLEHLAKLADDVPGPYEAVVFMRRG